MRILLVADGPVPHRYMNYRADRIVDYFSARGHKVTVVCARPEGSVSQILSGTSFIYIPEYKAIHRKRDLLYRVYMLLQLALKLRAEIRHGEYDLIRAVSMFPALAAVLVRNRQNKRALVVANISDFYSDLYEQFHLPFASVARMMLRALETFVSQKVDLLIVDTPVQRELWRTFAGVNIRCVALPHGVPESNRPSNKAPADCPENGHILERKEKLVFYVGDISHLDGVDVLLEAAHLLLNLDVKTRFLIVGRGSDKYMKFLGKRSETLGLIDRVRFLDRIPHYELGAVKADICVAPFRITPTSFSSVPNKVLEYLRIGVPIVASKVPALEQTLGNAISYTKPGSALSLAEAIAELCKSPSRYQEYAQRVIAARQRLSWDRIMAAEEKVLLSVVDTDDSQDQMKLFTLEEQQFLLPLNVKQTQRLS